MSCMRCRNKQPHPLSTAETVCPALEELLTQDGSQSSHWLYCTLSHRRWAIPLWACKRKTCLVRRCGRSFCDSSEMRSLVRWQRSEPWWPHSTLGCTACSVCTCFMCLQGVQPRPAPSSDWLYVKWCPWLELGFFPLLDWFLLACLGPRSGAKGAWPSAP